MYLASGKNNGAVVFFVQEQEKEHNNYLNVKARIWQVEVEEEELLLKNGDIEGAPLSAGHCKAVQWPLLLRQRSTGTQTADWINTVLFPVCYLLL